MADIVLLKLQTGEEIIGQLVTEDDDVIRLNKIRAMNIAPHQNGSGQMSVMMLPWIIALPDEDIQIPKTAIIGKPRGALPKALEDGYLQNVTGLQI